MLVRSMFTSFGKRLSNLPLKRTLDVSLAAAALAATSPIVAGACAAVYLSIGRPVFFRQQRPGQYGIPFSLVKLRTMRAPLPGEDAVASDSQRLSPVGRLLRSASIDELPTLWNVIKGDMSLVGPRPLLLQYLDRYTPEQARRHEVKPGITGWAQIHGRNTLSWEDKLSLDIWYVDHQSFWLDLEILTRTAWKVVSREGIAHEGQATMSEFMGTQATDG